MSDDRTTTEGHETSPENRKTRPAPEGSEPLGEGEIEEGEIESADEGVPADLESQDAEDALPDEEGGEEGPSGTGREAAAEADEGAEEPEAPDEGETGTSGDAQEQDEDIVLAEGKTLSDYLEDEPEPEPLKATEPVEFRSVSNVERLVVPPPGGLLQRARKNGEGGNAPRTGRSSAQENAAEKTAARTSSAARSTGEARPSGPRPDPAPRSGSDPAPAPPAQRAPHAPDLAIAPPLSPSTETAGEDALPSEPPRLAPARVPVPSIQISEEGNFGEMFESSLKAKSFEDGQSVKGVIVAIGPDVAFLDIGGKSEATIDIEELKDPEGDLEVEVGETIEAMVVSTDGGLKLSRKLARGAVAKEQIADAFRAGLPVEGRIEKAIKGGYEVRVAGQRAFCPISQIDTARTADPAVHVGKVYVFRIIEFKDGGKDLILSRRVLLQEEEKAQAEESRKSIVPDAILTGRVVSVRDYGAFVDLGGVQGLLHVSEMGWARVSNPSEIVKPGDEITVKVLRIDQEKGRISLGLKQLQPDPWSRVAEGYSAGQVVPGRIVRVQDFGAFVELEPGIEGLAHVSTFPPTGTPDGWKQNVTAGTKGMFEVLTVDLDRKRIGVAMVDEGSSRARAAEPEREQAPGTAGTEAAAPVARESSSGSRSGQDRTTIVPGARLNGKVERHEKYGVFVFLAPGRTGLMPAGESGTQRGTDLRRTFPIGSEIEVAVLEVDGKRIRLSRKALLDHEEKDDAREFAERRGPSTESFGSLGDKLRAALASKQK